MAAAVHDIRYIPNGDDKLPDRWCTDCGGCTCHTPGLLEVSCAEAKSRNPATFDHASDLLLMAQARSNPSDNALNELRRRLNYEPLPVADFEIRQTALQWVENNFSGIINFRTKTDMVEKTERYLRTGKFND